MALGSHDFYRLQCRQWRKRPDRKTKRRKRKERTRKKDAAEEGSSCISRIGCNFIRKKKNEKKKDEKGNNN